MSYRFPFHDKVMQVSQSLNADIIDLFSKDEQILIMQSQSLIFVLESHVTYSLHHTQLYSVNIPISNNTHQRKENI